MESQVNLVITLKRINFVGAIPGDSEVTPSWQCSGDHIRDAEDKTWVGCM